MVRLHQFGSAVTLALVAGAIAAVAAALPGGDPVAFEIVVEVGEGDARRTCVASRVGASWLLTAGHCLSGPVGNLHISCAGQDLSVQQTARHPTHDVALIASSDLDLCGAPVVAAGEPDQAGGPLRAPVLPGVGSTEMTEVGRDPQVLRLRANAGCWAAGDSGTPILLSDRIVAVLIAGPPGCQGTPDRRPARSPSALAARPCGSRPRRARSARVTCLFCPLPSRLAFCWRSSPPAGVWSRPEPRLPPSARLIGAFASTKDRPTARWTRRSSATAPPSPPNPASRCGQPSIPYPSRRTSPSWLSHSRRVADRSSSGPRARYRSS